MNLSKQGRIHLDLDDVVESNHTTITFGSFNLAHYMLHLRH